MKPIKDRFFSYVTTDTQSDETSTTCPSTKKQLNLARLLADELRKMGIRKVSLDENGYVMASIPSNIDRKIPVIGFIAHYDTSPDMTAEHVNPQITENYDGGEILLNKEQRIFLSPADFPELTGYKGQTLITTDGTTLLGADDKAGITEIMTAVEYLIENPSVKHGDISICFTPDEEIGRGADHFDVKAFGADFAYTMDGGELGELEYENFNAALATIDIKGRNVHPGTAKGKMINAIRVAAEFNGRLPEEERPETTEGYEGFYHLTDFNGKVENTKFRYIIRDHDRSHFEARKKKIMDVANELNEKYQHDTVTVQITDQYYNMREKIEPVMHIIDLARRAMIDSGVEPLIKPIRGGTDGARLSYMGLPCPNIFTGGHNFHGRYEYIPLQSMEKAVRVILRIIELHAVS